MKDDNKILKIRAARAAMRVWPAFCGLEAVSNSHEQIRECLRAAFLLPWSSLFHSELFDETQARRLVHELAAISGSEAASARSAAVAAANAYESSMNNRFASRAAAAADAAAATAAQLAANLAASDATEAEAATRAAAAADAASSRVESVHASTYIRRYLWDGAAARKLERSWRPVVLRWEKLMRSLDLGVWIDHYQQACDGRLTEEDIRGWFAEEGSEGPATVQDPAVAAEWLYHAAFDPSTPWSLAGDLDPEAIRGALGRIGSHGLSIEAHLAEMKGSMHRPPPDPLWLAWFAEVKWDEVRPLFVAGGGKGDRSPVRKKK
ncbi:hypothetical protein [Luteolibacter marinus]|uniref:hypothetical protein n=1 Tax=Luteolibacter marinus TaxID=2776705 RepID=UPI001867800F|nr:hypothetical protein [Luteolibacter marinus]